jgi:acetyl esterase/lipase
MSACGQKAADTNPAPESGKGTNSDMAAGISKETPVVPVINSMAPSGKEASPQSWIILRFNTAMTAESVEKIEVTSGGWTGGPTTGEKIPGTWSTDNGQQYTFAPAQPLKPGSLVVVRPTSSVLSETGASLRINADKPFYSFLVDDGRHHGSREIKIPSIKKTNDGDHNIPMNITLPTDKGPYPVMFWVHGGGWNGGTLPASAVEFGNQANYLADHLGVAVVGVAYRTKGSAGTFSQAMEDVADAIQYIRDHASEYDIDVQRLGLYGGSAGTPLASLAAQRTPEADLFIGYNGIYDFVHNPGSKFGNGNDYGQREPSAEANSPIAHLREHPPAVLLLHGTKDKTINPQQSVLFGKAVQAAGGLAKVLLYEGEDHAFFNPGKLMELPTLYEVKEFIRDIFPLK